MRKVFKKVLSHGITFIIAAIIFTVIGVVAATSISSAQVTYTGNSQSTVEGALDNLYTNYASKVHKKCIRAKTLHIARFSSTNQTMARYFGASSPSYTVPIGNLGTSGELNYGDAFDCDVNGDSIYDSIGERFYYVGRASNFGYYNYSNVAVLIAANNFNGNTIDNSTHVKFRSRTSNYCDADAAAARLPNWSNVKRESNSIIFTSACTCIDRSCCGRETCHGYNNSTRFPHAENVDTFSCVKYNGTAGGNFYTYPSLACLVLYENTKFFDSTYGTNGYWINMVSSSDTTKPLYLDAVNYNLHEGDPDDANVAGVRPIIEVLKTDMEY